MSNMLVSLYDSGWLLDVVHLSQSNPDGYCRSERQDGLFGICLEAMSVLCLLGLYVHEIWDWNMMLHVWFGRVLHVALCIVIVMHLTNEMTTRWRCYKLSEQKRRYIPQLCRTDGEHQSQCAIDNAQFAWERHTNKTIHHSDNSSSAATGNSLLTHYSKSRCGIMMQSASYWISLSPTEEEVLGLCSCSDWLRWLYYTLVDASVYVYI